VHCGPFGVEGTGVHGLFPWDFPMNETYSFIVLRYKRPDGLCEGAAWIHIPQLSRKYPGGWKHLMTATASETFNCKFRQTVAWIEHFASDLTGKERRAIFGPRFFKLAKGPWRPTDKVRTEWDLKGPNRPCGFATYEDIGHGRIDASTGTKEKNETLSSCPQEKFTSSKPVCGLPLTLAIFEQHRKQLFEKAQVRHYRETYDQNVPGKTTTWCGGHDRVACSLCSWAGDGFHNAFHDQGSYCHGDCKWERNQCMEKSC